MKNGWPTKLLADVCEIFADGDWVESKDQSPDGIRLIQTGNVGQGVFKDRGEKARYISGATFKRLRCTEIFEGDCLISRLPDPVGRSCILPDTGERMITAVDCTIVRFNSKQLLPAFFNFYSQSLDYLKAVDSATTGTTRNRISRNNLGLIPLPFPPLPEQQRIVGILDEAFAGIATAKAKAEKNLQNARALFESHLQSVISQRGEGWVEKTMDEVCAKITDGEHLRPKVTAGGVPFLSAKDVLDHDVILTDSLFVSEADALKFRKRCNPERGDILIVSRGATVGRTCVVKTTRVFCLLGSVILLKVQANLSSHFIAYALKSRAIKNRLMTMSEASAQQAIYLRDLKPLRIGFPSRTEQEAIVSRLDALFAEIQRLEFIYQQKLDAIEALKKSLLHQAFTGTL